VHLRQSALSRLKLHVTGSPSQSLNTIKRLLMTAGFRTVKEHKTGKYARHNEEWRSFDIVASLLQAYMHKMMVPLCGLVLLAYLPFRPRVRLGGVVVRTSDLQPSGRELKCRPFHFTYQLSASCSHTSSIMWYQAKADDALRLTVGLSSHWSCTADLVICQPTGSTA